MRSDADNASDDRHGTEARALLPRGYCSRKWRALCQTRRIPRTSLIARRTRIPAAHPPRSRSPSAMPSPRRSNRASTSLCRKKAKLPHQSQTNPAREAATRWAIRTRRPAYPILDRPASRSTRKRLSSGGGLVHDVQRALVLGDEPIDRVPGYGLMLEQLL